jgi:outer membrane protein assembly factor BamB
MLARRISIEKVPFFLVFLATLIAGHVAGAASQDPPPAAASPEGWPSFRGPGASGVADGQDLPDAWDGETGKNVRWKVRIPGLAHSSPVVWGGRLFVTSAVSRRDDATFRHGLYGSGDASGDRSVHRFVVYCLDRISGEILWMRTAHEGVPRDKRHIKATYANASPVTDGRYVVAMFGSEGLFAFDVDGRPLWTKGLGRLDVGAYDAPDYEWGAASSPILYGDLVIVQCDTQGDSFLIAVDVRTGKTVWKAERDELPSWGTPTVHRGAGRHELIANGSNYVRAYDPRTGEELWRLGGSSKITAPTPFVADGLIVVASGRTPEKPIFVLRPGARGDITLAEGRTSNESVVWSKAGVGPYMPTPIAYGGRLYVLGNNGVLDCYDLRSGEEIFRERIPHVGGGFSASPVAADGKLYLSGEDGDVFVVRAGGVFELIARNPLGERIMATPALAGGTLYVRAEHTLFAIGR